MGFASAQPILRAELFLAHDLIRKPVSTFRDHALMRVLLLGFGRFPGAPRNPSAVLVKRLARRRRPALAAITRTVHVFATTYAAVDTELPKLFAGKPDIVLMFGLAARRRHLCVETQARNAVSVLFPDARGFRPIHGVIAAGERATVRSTAPFARLLGAVRASGVPARVSRDAGRYVCNYAYWRALGSADYQGGPLVQFVHIPRIGFDARPKRKQKSRPPPLRVALTAAENLLIALIAARRSRR
jgi:pyroglutamyl-peptidase